MERLVFFIKLMLLLLSFILTSFLNDDKIENFLKLFKIFRCEITLAEQVELALKFSDDMIMKLFKKL